MGSLILQNEQNLFVKLQRPQSLCKISNYAIRHNFRIRMSVKARKNILLLIEISAIKLEKGPESALILEKGLLESCRAKTH